MQNAGHHEHAAIERAHRGRTEVWTVHVPVLGTFELSGPELIYVGGVVGLAALGLLDWPIGLVIAGGHLLAADRSSRAARDLGEAMTEAG